MALLLLTAGWTIPFRYESFSILYKFGLEKTFLRAGKLMGITLVLLFFFQVALASRFTLLEQVFSRRSLMLLHRRGGMLIGFLAVLHPLLIKASENFTAYTLEKKYYPEFMGFGVLAVLLILVLTAVLRNLFGLSYRNWLLQHRTAATLLLCLAPAHVLFVSETFKSGLPRGSALSVFSLIILMLAAIWVRRIRRPAG